MTANPSQQAGAAVSASAGAANFPERWLIALAIAAIAAAACAVLWPTCRTLIVLWADKDILSYTHGWLIALISAALLLRTCMGFTDEPVAISWRAMSALAALSVLWLVMLRAGIEIGHQALLPILLWLATYAALGRGIALRLAFPFAYLYFAVPVWSLGNGVLQALTVQAARLLLMAVGVPAYVEGDYVHLASGVFEIAGGCSGLHFFIVALAIAALYGEVNRDRLRTRVLTLVLGAVIAVAANWLRVFTIIIAGYLTDMQHYLVRVDHYTFGWVVFAVAMTAFFLIVRYLPPAAQDLSGAAVTAQPSPGRGSRLAVGAIASVAALSIGPAWGFVRPAMPSAPVARSLPAAVPSWTRDAWGEHAWRPVFAGADLVDRAVYRRGEAEIAVYEAVYFSQRQGKELIGYGNTLTGEPAPVIEQVSNVPVGRVVLRELSLHESGMRSLLWYVYEIDGRYTTSSIGLQLLYGFRSLTGRAPAARVIALRASCRQDCASARQNMAELLAALFSPAATKGD